MYRIPFSRRVIRRLAILVAATIPVATMAQTCQSPLPIVNNQLNAGNTCNFGVSLPSISGIALPHQQAIYKLTSNAVLGGSIDFPGSNFSGAVGLIMDGCNYSANVLGVFDPLDGSGLALPTRPAGDYYLVITGDPSLYPNPAACGSYALIPHLTETAPVAGTCAAPLRFRRGEKMSGNTCNATDTSPMIAQTIASPQNDLVFRINRASMTTDRLYITSADTGMLAVVQATCSTPAPALAWAGIPAGGSTSLDVSHLPAGDHYLIITADPAGPASGCGGFGLTDLPPGVTRKSSEFMSLVAPVFYAEPFTVLPRGATPQRINFRGNGFAYSVTPQGANAALAVATSMDVRDGKALAVNASSAPRTMRIAFTGATVTAVGGLFGVTGLPDVSPATTMTVSLRSGTRVSSFRLDGTGGFWGFSGSARIDELIISTASIQGKPTLDSLLVGQAL